jgi:tetrahydrodipicolinate N-succinyltransferase
VPDAGDFRIDVEEQAKTELQQQYKSYYETKLAEAMKDAWTRLHDTLKHLSERMDYTDENKKKFWDSTITNATELCALLTKLNVTNDPKLEEARQKLEKALVGVKPEDIRESEAIRTNVKSKVDEILNMF